MIIHGRIYQDIIPVEEIEFSEDISEFNSVFKYNLGGIANIINTVENSKLIIYGEIKSFNKIKNEFKLVEHYNTHDIKAIILKTKIKKSRLSIIETKEIINDSLINYNLVSSIEVLMYLESIPRLFLPKKNENILISIYNGGRNLINEKIFLSNLKNSTMLIASKDSYNSLIKNKTFINEINNKIPIIILHSPKSYEIKCLNDERFVKNSFYDKNKKNHFVGLGDKFSTIFCESLSKEKIYDMNHLEDCINYAAKRVCEYVK